MNCNLEFSHQPSSMLAHVHYFSPSEIFEGTPRLLRHASLWVGCTSDRFRISKGDSNIPSQNTYRYKYFFRFLSKTVPVLSPLDTSLIFHFHFLPSQVHPPYRIFLLFLPWLSCHFQSCYHRTTTQDFYRIFGGLITHK